MVQRFAPALVLFGALVLAAGVVRAADPPVAKAKSLKAKGDFLVVAGKPTAAVSAYKAALMADPGMTSARAALASTLSDLGRYDQAIFELEEAMRLEPEFHEGLLRIGDVELKRKGYPEAVLYYRFFLAKRKRDPDGLRGLAEAFAASGDRARAIDAFRKYIKYEKRKSERAAVARAKTAMKELATSPTSRIDFGEEDRPSTAVKDPFGGPPGTAVPPAPGARTDASLKDPFVAGTSSGPPTPAAEKRASGTGALKDPFGAGRAASPGKAKLDRSSSKVRDPFGPVVDVGPALAPRPEPVKPIPPKPEPVKPVAPKPEPVPHAVAPEPVKPVAPEPEPVKLPPDTPETMSALERAKAIADAEPDAVIGTGPLTVDAEKTDEEVAPSVDVEASTAGTAKITVRDIEEEGETIDIGGDLEAGDVAFASGDYRTAEMLYRTAAEDGGYHAGAWFKLGAAQLLMEKIDAAIESWKRALALDRDNAALREKLERLYALRTRKIEHGSLEDASPRPVAPEMRMIGAEDLLRDGRPTAALTEIGAVLAVRKGSADALYDRGEILLALGRYAEAAESFKRALGAESGWAAPVQALGDVYRRSGDERLARYYYERFLEMAEDSTRSSDAADVPRVVAILAH